MDISRPCQLEKLIPLLPGPGYDPSFSGHNDRPIGAGFWRSNEVEKLLATFKSITSNKGVEVKDIKLFRTNVQLSLNPYPGASEMMHS